MMKKVRRERGRKKRRDTRSPVYLGRDTLSPARIDSRKFQRGAAERGGGHRNAARDVRRVLQRLVSVPAPYALLLLHGNCSPSSLYVVDGAVIFFIIRRGFITFCFSFRAVGVVAKK